METKTLRIILVCLFVTKLERKIGAVSLSQRDAISKFHDALWGWMIRWCGDAFVQRLWRSLCRCASQWVENVSLFNGDSGWVGLDLGIFPFILLKIKRYFYCKHAIASRINQIRRVHDLLEGRLESHIEDTLTLICHSIWNKVFSGERGIFKATTCLKVNDRTLIKVVFKVEITTCWKVNWRIILQKASLPLGKFFSGQTVSSKATPWKLV